MINKEIWGEIVIKDQRHEKRKGAQNLLETRKSD
jgi:hypothetical protein